MELLKKNKLKAFYLLIIFYFFLEMFFFILFYFNLSEFKLNYTEIDFYLKLYP